MSRNLKGAYDLIKRWEGIEDGDPTTVNLDPYRDPAGVFTIGWGHAIRDLHGHLVRDEATARRLYLGGITTPEAEALLANDVRPVVDAVTRLVTVPITDNQFNALVDFAFNLGTEALRTSTLLRYLNQGRYASAADQFTRWNKARDPATGRLRILDGLTKRRLAERTLFLQAAGESAVPFEKDRALQLLAEASQKLAEVRQLLS